MAFQGTLDTVGLEDVFQLFAFSRKSGALHLDRNDNHGVVYFRDGSVYYASANLGEGIGNVLVRAGLVSADTWSRVVGEARDGATLSEVLLRSVDDDGVAIEALLRERVEDAVFQLIQWNEGAFDLRDETHPFGPAFSFACDGLLDEARRRLAVWERIRVDIPATDMGVGIVRSLADDVTEIALNRAEWRVLATITPGMDIAELAVALGQTEFSTVQVLHAMLGRAIVEVHSREKLALLRDLAGHQSASRPGPQLADAVLTPQTAAPSGPDPDADAGSAAQGLAQELAQDAAQELAEAGADVEAVAEAASAEPSAEPTGDDRGDDDADDARDLADQTAGIGAVGADGNAASADGIAAVIAATANVEEWRGGDADAADTGATGPDEAGVAEGDLVGLFRDGGETKPKAKVSFAELAAAEDADETAPVDDAVAAQAHATMHDAADATAYDHSSYAYADTAHDAGYYDQPHAEAAYGAYGEYQDPAADPAHAHTTGEMPAYAPPAAADAESELDKSLILRMIAGVRSL